MYYLYNHPAPNLLLSLRLLVYPEFILSCPSFIFLSQTHFPLQFPYNTILYHTSINTTLPSATESLNLHNIDRRMNCYMSIEFCMRIWTNGKTGFSQIYSLGTDMPGMEGILRFIFPCPAAFTVHDGTYSCITGQGCYCVPLQFSIYLRALPFSLLLKITRMQCNKKTSTLNKHAGNTI